MRIRLAVTLVCALALPAHADEPTPASAPASTAPTAPTPFTAPIAPTASTAPTPSTAPSAPSAQLATIDEPPARPPLRIAPAPIAVVAPAEPSGPPPTVTLTFNPVLTAFSIAVGGIAAVAEGEFNIHPHAGLSVYAIGAQIPGLLDSGSSRIFLGGVKAQWYPLHAFSGMHAGALAGAGTVSTTGGDGPFFTTLPGTATVVEAGGFGGWKYIGRSGFTFVGELGALVVVGHNSDNGKTAMNASPYLNLNVGWSF